MRLLYFIVPLSLLYIQGVENSENTDVDTDRDNTDDNKDLPGDTDTPSDTDSSSRVLRKENSFEDDDSNDKPEKTMRYNKHFTRPKVKRFGSEYSDPAYTDDYQMKKLGAAPPPPPPPNTETSNSGLLQHMGTAESLMKIVGKVWNFAQKNIYTVVSILVGVIGSLFYVKSFIMK